MVNLVSAWRFLSTAAMMLGWMHVVVVLVAGRDCATVLVPATRLALQLSFLEFFNAVAGVTKSKPQFVLLFAVVRYGVEAWLAPLLSCDAWAHLLTVACWSCGDVVRFGCFVWESKTSKWTRYTVGPILFPLGASGEVWMVLTAAREGRPILYGAALLWPAGFYPLMKQLLRQRRKFISANKGKTIKAV